MRLHILGVPHTITRPEYSTCAFTQKVLKLSKMLRALGHVVIHYGNEASDVDCDEHVTVTTLDDLDRSYPGHDWRRNGFPAFSMNTDPIYRTFYANAIAEIHRRREPFDFLLCPFGRGHEAVAKAHEGMIVVEPGIGYPGGTFAPFRVFESYAIMHAYQGAARVESMSNSMWYDVVIPNYFDPEAFQFSAEGGGYFLFLGRVGPGKGSHIALQVVDEIKAQLVVAGMGEIGEAPDRVRRPLRDFVSHRGVVGPTERAKLLAGAKATICASTYLEPFCGVQIESMLSGTPVISTDWGAFAEYNPHGVTGYRCRTFEQFVWAARNIEGISRHACRAWGLNFNLDRVGKMYDEYFDMVSRVYRGDGWYDPNPERAGLGWLSRHYPACADG